MFHEDDRDMSFVKLREKIPQVSLVVRYSKFVRDWSLKRQDLICCSSYTQISPEITTRRYK